MKKIVILIQLAILLVIIVINFSFLNEEFLSKIGLNITSRGETSLFDDRMKSLLEDDKKDIVIGVAAPVEELRKNNHLFIEGVEYVADRINMSGGINGRKIKLIIEDDKNSPDEATKIADRFSRNLNIPAVIGHLITDTAVVAAIIYDFHGLLLLSPAMHSPKHEEEAFSLIFWNAPSAVLCADIISKYIIDKAYKNVLFITDDRPGSSEVSGYIMSILYKHNINIVDNIMFDSNSTQEFFDTQLDSCPNFYDINAVVITNQGACLKAVNALKKKNYKGLIITTGIFEYKYKTEAEKNLLEGIISPVLPEYDKNILESFINGFSKKYGVEPDSYSIKGYETAMILFEALKKQKLPEDIAYILRNTGVSPIGRKVRFDKNGVLVFDSSSNFKLKKFQNGIYTETD